MFTRVNPCTMLKVEFYQTYDAKLALICLSFVTILFLYFHRSKGVVSGSSWIVTTLLVLWGSLADQ